MRRLTTLLCILMLMAGAWAALPEHEAGAAEECCCWGPTLKPLAWPDVCDTVLCVGTTPTCGGSVSSGWNPAVCYQPQTNLCKVQLAILGTDTYDCWGPQNCDPPTGGKQCMLTHTGSGTQMVWKCVQPENGGLLCDGGSPPPNLCEHQPDH